MVNETRWATFELINVMRNTEMLESIKNYQHTGYALRHHAKHKRLQSTLQLFFILKENRTITVENITAHGKTIKYSQTVKRL